MGNFDPKKYATVAERLAQAQPLITSVTTEAPQMISDTMGFVRAAVTLSDGRLATGIASFRLDLTTRSAQATNPIEDCETSAVGRALAFLGYAADKSIASQEEVDEAMARQAAGPPRGRATFTPVRPTTTNARQDVVSADLADELFSDEDPDAEPDPNRCPVHGAIYTYRGGISGKTGKPWGKWSCPVKEDGQWCQQGRWATADELSMEAAA